MGPLARSALGQVARRPELWLTALAQWRALLAPRWWARWPPVPGPPKDYMSFRLQTMYGSSRAQVSAAELVSYLEWCRRMRLPAR
jgi:hypothetical protein